MSGAALLLLAGYGVYSFFGAAADPVAEPTEDPTKFGPDRTLRLTTARVTTTPAGAALLVEGRTNLVAGALLEVRILARHKPIQVYPATVSKTGLFKLEVPAPGKVVQGDYQAEARFLLEGQPRSVQEALRFQPRSLTVTLPLTLPPDAPAADTLRAELRALFDAVNQAPRDRNSLAKLDEQALALSQSLWIAEQKAALQKLRLAIEEAGRAEFRRDAFDRLILEAHVLAGL